MVLESFNNGILYIDIAFVYNRCTVYKVFRIKGSDCMKIEKVNDNQIRCTLTREDLAERQIKLSELAYGTEKAKMLFRDMMQQAAYEFGFEADDIPLMIEAIPLSADTIILVITKVEYPEELDTRFSKFSDPDPEDLYDDAIVGGNAPISEGADDILGLFKKQQELRNAAKTQQNSNFVPSDGGQKEKEGITKKHIHKELPPFVRTAQMGAILIGDFFFRVRFCRTYSHRIIRLLRFFRAVSFSGFRRL